MAYIPLNQIVDALDQLDAQQKQILLGILQDTTTLSSTKAETTLSNMEEIRGARFHDGLIGPHCKVHCKFKKNGTYRDRQRYLCKSCDRTFNDLTSTPLHGTKYPEKWAAYLKVMEQGFSLRKCAQEVRITLPTSFEWRHKILHALSVNAYHQRFKSFLHPFQGVATKYLNHYVAYHHFMDDTTNLTAMSRTKEVFLRAMMQPMKTTGSRLSAYCDEQIIKMTG